METWGCIALSTPVLPSLLPSTAELPATGGVSRLGTRATGGCQLGQLPAGARATGRRGASTACASGGPCRPWRWPQLAQVSATPLLCGAWQPSGGRRCLGRCSRRAAAGRPTARLCGRWLMSGGARSRAELSRHAAHLLGRPPGCQVRLEGGASTVTSCRDRQPHPCCRRMPVFTQWLWVSLHLRFPCDPMQTLSGRSSRMPTRPPACAHATRRHHPRPGQPLQRRHSGSRSSASWTWPRAPWRAS